MVIRSDERREKMNKKRELVKYGKLLHDQGFVIGSGGNISIRDKNNIVIKKQGTNMATGGKEAYLSISFSAAAKGNRRLSSETPLHLACYGARGDIGAVIHVHAPYSIAAGEKTKVMQKSISYEFECVLGGNVPVIGYIKPGSEKLAETIAKKIKTGANAVIMRKHGAVAVGRDLQEAFVRIQALERACVTFLHIA